MRPLRCWLLAACLVAVGAASVAAQTFEERLSLCMACHGEKGVSESPAVPSLGGQPSMYVLIQLYMFREKLRKIDLKNDLAQGLSDVELQKLGDIIAKLPPPPPADGVDSKRAQRASALISTHRCAFCHNNLSGGDAVPRIAAQREDYLLKALTEYKSGARTEYQPVMSDVMRRLTEADIQDLAHYLARTGAK
jgi:cytochrome c553